MAPHRRAPCRALPGHGPDDLLQQHHHGIRRGRVRRAASQRVDEAHDVAASVVHVPGRDQNPLGARRVRWCRRRQERTSDLRAAHIERATFIVIVWLNPRDRERRRLSIGRAAPAVRPGRQRHAHRTRTASGHRHHHEARRDNPHRHASSHLDLRPSTLGLGPWAFERSTFRPVPGARCPVPDPYNSRVISTIVRRNCDRSKRRWAPTFFSAVPSTTRGMPRPRSHSHAASIRAVPAP